MPARSGLALTIGFAAEHVRESSPLVHCVAPLGATPFVADFVGLTNRLRGVVAGSTATVLGGNVPLLAGSAGDGDAVILVRPEGITVTPATGESTSGNATIVSASFLGASGRVVARGDDEALVRVQVDNSELAAYQPGDRVLLRPRGDAALAVSPS